MIKNHYAGEIDKEALFNEISILRRLNHPNIIKLHEVYETSTLIGLVFDEIKGGELKLSKKYTESEAISLLKPLVEAIAYLHDLGIFHRDVKPSNVLIREKDNLSSACLIDFGLADHWNEEGRYLFYRCGTPGYVAPEVLRDAKYTTQVDVYSLGALLYTLLAGQNPFEYRDYETTVLNNYEGKVDFSRLKISSSMMELIQMMLHINPQERITPKNILKHNVFADNFWP